MCANYMLLKNQAIYLGRLGLVKIQYTSGPAGLPEGLHLVNNVLSSRPRRLYSTQIYNLTPFMGSKGYPLEPFWVKTRHTGDKMSNCVPWRIQNLPLMLPKALHSMRALRKIDS